MINYISIKDFAIIENIEIDLNNGLNIITGETGSGKSIIIEAISLALGSRADTTMVRDKAPKAKIQIVFDNDLIVTREVSKSGKSLAKINGEIVSLSDLNSYTAKLVDIHGQYDHQSLLDSDNHIKIIDEYDKATISPLLAKVGDAYAEYSKLNASLKELLQTESASIKEQQFWEFELKEINNLDPKIGEDIEISEKLKVLQNSEKIYKALSISYTNLNEINLGPAKNELENINIYSQDLENLSGRINDIYYELEDISGETQTLLNSMDFSQEEINELISRLDTLDRLKAKHNVSTIDEILKYKDDIEHKLSFIESFDQSKDNLQAELDKSYQDLIVASTALHHARKKISLEIEEKITCELKELSFTNTEFKIKFHDLQVSENGIDRIEFLISPNKGLPLLPLSKIVSGGEMSRIMLALKSITGDLDEIPTMIFDEIDTGISGATASIVGEKMQKMSNKHQLICITHLPQIAAYSKNHYRIEKTSDDEITYTTIKKLDRDQHIKEIARLLGGREVSESALKNAEELIDTSLLSKQ